jgi:hypothetical protein
MTPRTVIELRPIWRLLRQLRAALIDADWNGDDTTTIRAAIARLEMLQLYGETHDVLH